MGNFDLYLGKANMTSVNFFRKSLKFFKELHKYLDMNDQANNSLSPNALRKLNICSKGERLFQHSFCLPRNAYNTTAFFSYLPQLKGTIPPCVFCPYFRGIEVFII